MMPLGLRVAGSFCLAWLSPLGSLECSCSLVKISNTSLSLCLISLTTHTRTTLAPAQAPSSLGPPLGLHSGPHMILYSEVTV